MTKTTGVSVADIIARIKASAQGRAEDVRRGRYSSWLDLGDIFVGAIEIEGDDKAKADLNQKVKDLPEMKERADWLKGKSVVEKLLVATFGYEATHSKRHYCKRACGRAKKLDPQPKTAEEFAKWVEIEGGIIAAANGDKTPRTASSALGAS